MNALGKVFGQIFFIWMLGMSRLCAQVVEEEESGSFSGLAIKWELGLAALPLGLGIKRGQFAWGVGGLFFTLFLGFFLGLIVALLACGLSCAVIFFIPERKLTAEEVAKHSWQPPQTQDTAGPDIHVAVGDDTRGPFSLQEVRTAWASGKLPSAALYWKEGQEQWEPINKLFL